MPNFLQIMIFMQQFSCKQNQAIFYAIAILFFDASVYRKKVFSGRGRLESGLLTTTVAVARNVAATDVTYMRERGQ